MANAGWRMADAATERAAHVSWVSESGWPLPPFQAMVPGQIFGTKTRCMGAADVPRTGEENAARRG